MPKSIKLPIFDTMQESSENLTGPGSTLVPLITVIALCIATAGGIWWLHKTLYIDPVDPIRMKTVSATVDGK